MTPYLEFLVLNALRLESESGMKLRYTLLGDTNNNMICFQNNWQKIIHVVDNIHDVHVIGDKEVSEFKNSIENA